MPSKHPRRPLHKDSPSTSGTSTTVVDPSIPAYTIGLLAKRDAISAFPDILVSGSDDDEHSSGNGLGKITGKRKAKDSAEGIVGRVEERVRKAYVDAHGRPSDGRWAHVVQILRLSCTQGRYRFIAPQKASSGESHFDYTSWAKQISSLLRSQWTPRAGEDYELDLKNRALTEWIPTDLYPTRETTVIRQILEKREWSTDVTGFVRNWFDDSTRDGLTEITVILEKKRLLDKLVNVFLLSLIPTDATEAVSGRIKDFEKERWIEEITRFIERKGAPAPALLRHATDNQSFNTKERKTIALREKVKTWQKGVVGESDNPVLKQSSLEFATYKPSAARLSVGKPSASFRSQPQDREDEDEDDQDDGPALVFPSQPSFRSSQIINESTPNVLRKPPSPVPSSSSPRLDVSPDARVYDRLSPSAHKSKSKAISRPLPIPLKKRSSPENPSHSSHPSKHPRREDKDRDTDMLPPPIPPTRPNACLARTTATPPKARMPTLTELLTAKKAAGARMTPNNKIGLGLGGKQGNKKANMLLIHPSPSPSPLPLTMPEKANAQAGSSRGGSVSAGPSKPSGPPGSALGTAKATDSVRATSPLSESRFHPPPVPVPEPLQKLKSKLLETQSSIAPSASASVQHHQRRRQASTSSIRSGSTSLVEHQPEFTASGYALDLPLSILDGRSGLDASNSLLRLRVGSPPGDKSNSKPSKRTKDADQGQTSKAAADRKKKKKKRGYFGMEDIDLDSPNKLKPGVVRPFADSSSSQEGSEEEAQEKSEVEKNPSTSPLLVTPQKPKKTHSRDRDRSRSYVSAAFESQIPDFTFDAGAFDPPQVSTQRRSVSGNNHQFEYEYIDGDNSMNVGEGEGSGTSSYGAPPIFTKDGTINIQSLEDPTSGAFRIPGLNSLTKTRRREGGEMKSPLNEHEQSQNDGDPSQSQSQAPDGFGFGYSSQKDVDGDADRVSRFVDRDVDLMDVDDEGGDRWRF